mgnify:FL=1
MNFTNKFTKYFLLLFIFNISCSSPRISVFALNYSPNFSKKIFIADLGRTEKNAIKDPDNTLLQFQASKKLITYLYGFSLNEAEELKNQDYDKGKAAYLKTHNEFVRSLNYINTSLVLDYPNFLLWINGQDNNEIKFKKESAEKLYWAAGAYAGAIQSSNGDPEWIIQLPKIGLLLEEGMKLDSSWNFGSFYTAMISYSIIRHDAKEDKFIVAQNYFKKAVEASDGQDLSPYISYAENIAVSSQNKKDFTNMLYKALNIDIYANPELTLTNYIGRKRANWLLDNIDELFY